MQLNGGNNKRDETPFIYTSCLELRLSSHIRMSSHFYLDSLLVDIFVFSSIYFTNVILHMLTATVVIWTAFELFVRVVQITTAT